MKTTIDIADPLLATAKRLAARRRTSLRQVVEEALRETLRCEEGAGSRPTVLVTHTFHGRGLQPGRSWDDWASLRDLAYEGRGG